MQMHLNYPPHIDPLHIVPSHPQNFRMKSHLPKTSRRFFWIGKHLVHLRFSATIDGGKKGQKYLCPLFEAQKWLGVQWGGMVCAYNSVNNLPLYKFAHFIARLGLLNPWGVMYTESQTSTHSPTHPPKMGCANPCKIYPIQPDGAWMGIEKSGVGLPVEM